jgi:hypothetical protein
MRVGIIGPHAQRGVVVGNRLRMPAQGVVDRGPRHSGGSVLGMRGHRLTCERERPFVLSLKEGPPYVVLP